MSQQTYNFPAQNKGDTFNGVQFTLEVNGVAKDISTALISCWFRAERLNTIAKEISVGHGITITDGPNGVFRIDPFIVTMTHGNYSYDIEFDFAGVIKTYISGKFIVNQTVTNG